MPTDISHDTLTSPDGTRLFVRYARVVEPRALIIIAHGLGEHSGRYGHVIDFFAQRGYGVAAYDHRGHGMSGGERGDVARFSDWIDDLRFVLGAFRARAGAGIPLFALGHSLGGLVALSFAGLYGEADGLILSAPALGPLFTMPEWKLRVGERAARVMPRFHVSAAIDPTNLTRDPTAARAFETDPLVLKRFTLRVGQEIIGAAADAMPLSYRIKLPTLIIQARDDRVCSSEVTSRFFAQIANPSKKIILYDGAFHEPFNDVIRDRAMEDVDGWIRSSALETLYAASDAGAPQTEAGDSPSTGKVESY